MNTRPLCRPI